MAFAAIAILVLRPVCDAAEPLERGAAHSHAGWQQDQRGEAQPCCASIQDGWLTPAATLLPDVVKPSLALPVPAFAQRGSSTRPRVTAHPPPQAPLSYHARSARLLL